MGRPQKKNKTVAKATAALDLNKDGKLDKADKTMAAKVLATKPAPVVPSAPQGKYAKTDISLTYRKGDFVPQEQIDKWESMGYHLDQWFD